MAETAHAGLGNGPGAPGGSQGSGGAQEKAQQVVGDAKDQAKEQAQQVKEQAGGRLKGEVDRRSTEAGERVKSQANDLRSVGEQLREQGKDGPAKVADQVAERAERVGGYLHESDGERILNDVEDLARRNPWAVVAGGLVLGIVASRLLKASSVERSQRRVTTGPTYGRPALPSPVRSGYGGNGGDALVGDSFGVGGTTPAPETPRFDREDDPLRRGGGL